MGIGLYLDGVPVRQLSAAMFEQLRAAIVSGRLAAGDRLPASRELAVELGVARSTVTMVYGRLVAEGFAEGRVGDGTVVADNAATTSRVVTRWVDGGGARTRRRVHGLLPGLGSGHAWRCDLRTGRPDPRFFPLAAWRRALTTVHQYPPPGYGDPAGHEPLRRTIAAWIGRSRAVRTTPEQVIITAGAQGAFDLCARVLIGDGDTVAVENPGYLPAWRSFGYHGATVAPTPIDRDGLVVESIPGNAVAIYVTPSHQLPSGVVLTPIRRRQLLALAAKQDAVVIEDDYDTEFRYVDRPLEPLQRLDTDGRVVYIGSFSKTLSPSVRIGFIVAPPSITADLVAAREVVDIQPPFTSQAALAELIANGTFERHLRRTRRAYAARRHLVVERLQAMAEEGLVTEIGACHAGLHLTVELHPDIDPDQVAAMVRGRGVAIESTTGNWDGPHRPSLAIGFGLADLDTLDVGLTELAATLRQPR